MTVSEYIFNFLYEKGCTRTYMVSGSSAMWLTDALCRDENMQAVCTHHEQAAAMAADGYARVNGVPGACLVTIGPGVTNAITGVAQAYFDSSPIFVISGQANSRLLQYAKDSGIRQNACQSMIVEPVVGTVTKYCKTVMDASEIIGVMEEAYDAAMFGRKGPVWIDVPVDIQNRQVPEEAFAKVKGLGPADAGSGGGIGDVPAADGGRPKGADPAVCQYQGESTPEGAAYVVSQADYDRIAGLLETAERPLILAGYGVRASQAVEVLERFAERFRIPVVTSRGGIDVIASDHPLCIGRPGGYGDRASHFAVQECDLLFILGSRLSVSTIGYYPDRLAGDAVKVMVDIDEKELERDAVPVQYKYRTDVKGFLEALMERMDAGCLGRMADHGPWISHCQKNREKYPVVLKEYAQQKPLNSYYFTSVLSDLAPAEANIIVDTGSVYCTVSQSWKLKKGQRYIASGGFSCMGSWATALGAVQKGRALIALSGDGSTQMNIQELATLKYNRLPVKLFVYNNHGYMLIRHNQHNYMDDRFLGVGPDSGVETPDFCAVAGAYGVKAARITAEDDLAAKIREVLEAEGPVVCEVMVQEFGEIIPKIASRVMPDGSLKAAEFDDLYPFLGGENDAP